jgi:hypothetical protein
VSRARWSGLVALLALVLLPAAGARAAECPPGSPTLVTTVNGKASGPVYTTHDLLVHVKLSGGAFTRVDSLNVTGLRSVPKPDDEETQQDEVFGIADAPGTLTVTATVTNEDMDPPCTVSGTASFDILQATAPIVSRLRKPPVFKGHRPWLWDSRYWFWVKPGPTGNVSPITVEARAIKRARIPGPSVPAKSFTLPMRPSDGPVPRLEPHGNCDAYQLICTRRIRTWADGAQVDVRPLGGREVPAAVKVLVDLPSGIPTLHFSLRKTPIGLDIKLLQQGATIARLRMAGRCDPRGQFFLCRYKKLSTAL